MYFVKACAVLKLAILCIWMFGVTDVDASEMALTRTDQLRLTQGQHVRVIVWFSDGAIPLDATEEVQEAWVEHISTVRDSTLRRVFGRSRVALSQPSGSAELLVREFRYLPAAAMILNQNEIAALNADDGVVRITSDSLSRPAAYNDQIGVTPLHQQGATGAGVTIAILDTGVDRSHTMFARNWVDGACFSSNVVGQSSSFCDAGNTGLNSGDNCEELSDNPLSGADGCAHGTLVAGIALGGQGTEPFDPISVAPSAGLVSVQVFSRFTGAENCGSSSACALSYSSDQIAALEWLYTQRTRLRLGVINMSLGGGEYTDYCRSDPRLQIISLLRSANVATVIATGNDAYVDAINSPACIEPSISVASVGRNTNFLSDFSNFNYTVDFAAPGENVFTAFPTANDIGPPRTATADGTSMSAPHVAGAIAILQSLNPGATVDEIESALATTGFMTRGYPGFPVPGLRVDQANVVIQSHPNGQIGSVIVSPVREFETSGRLGEPGSFETAIYSLRNTTGVVANWQVSSPEDWLLFTVGSTPIASGLPTLSGSLAPGETVDLTVSVAAAATIPGAYRGRIRFASGPNSIDIAASVRVFEPVPLNDRFENAFRLSRPEPQVNYSTNLATRDEGEPNHAGIAVNRTVWWAWSPRVTARMRFWIPPTSFDTVLAIYTGDRVDDLTELVSNDDNVPGSDSRSVVEFEAVAGETYRIAIGGHGDQSGDATFVSRMISNSENETVETAERISGETGIATGRTTEAGNFTMWYVWNAPRDGDFSVQTSSAASASHRATIYTRAENGSLTQVGTSNFSTVEHDGPARASVVHGQDYFIKLVGWSNYPPTLVSWWMGPVGGGVLRSSVLPSIRGVRLGDTVTAFTTVINPVSTQVTAENCVILPPQEFDGSFEYRATDPTTNEAIGDVSPRFQMESGEVRTFVMSFVPGTVGYANYFPLFQCNGLRARKTQYVNGLTISAQPNRTPDIISIMSTPSGDGVANVRLGGVSALAAAAFNIGASGRTSIRPSTLYRSLSLEICETNPATAECVSERADEVIVDFGQNEVRTFSIFVRSDGTPFEFNPAGARLLLTFRSNNWDYGQTSAALRAVE